MRWLDAMARAGRDGARCVAIARAFDNSHRGTYRRAMRDRWLAVRVAGVVCVMAAGSCSRRASTEAAERVNERVNELSPDAVVEASVTGSAHERFAVAMAAGDYAELVVDQRGVDVELDVRGPGAKAVVVALDLAGGTTGDERYGFIAGEAGRYGIDVHAAYPVAAVSANGRDRFRLALHGPRPAGAADRRRAAAYATTDELAAMLGWKPDAPGAASGDARRAALVRCEALRTEWVALADRRGEGEALELCATAARHLARPAEAEAYSDRARDIYHELGWAAAEGASLLERGSGLHIRGEIVEARRVWERALALSEQAGDLGTQAIALSGIGVASLALDDYRRARDELLRSRKLAASIGRDDTVAVVDDNLGSAYARLGDAELALDRYAHALAGYERGGTDFEAGRTRVSRAVVYRNLLDDPATARSELEQALAVLRRAGNRDGESLALIELGLTLRAMGDLAQASSRFDEAVALARAIGSSRLLARARASQGLIALDRGDPDAALVAYAEARSEHAAAGARGAQGLALIGHARALIARGDVAAARVDVAAALALIEDVRAGAPSPELRATYLASVRTAYDLAVDLEMQLDHGRGGGHAIAAFEASERGRSRGLLEVVRAGGDPIAATPDARAALDAAAADVTRLESVHAALVAGSPTAAAVRASERAIAVALEHQREALDALRARNPRAAALIAPPPVALAEVQALLDRDSVLLEYVVAEPRSYVFAVGPRSLIVRALPGRTEIEAAARALYGELTARNAAVAGEPARTRAERIAAADAAVPAAAATLARLVVAPVADQLVGRRRVLVAPDGALAYIPFAMLPVAAAGDARPAMLVDDHDLVTLPSAAVLGALRARHSRPPAAAPRVAIVADPVYGAGDPRIARGERSVHAGVPPLHELPRLPFAAEEAAAIVALLPAERTQLTTGLAARRELFTSGALRDYDIVHIAAHGVVNAHHPDLSGIALAMVDDGGGEQDGFLRLHDLYQLEIGAELVTLSGCETALGREIRGEGMIGLARGFLHAGARRVVASLWQVHDRATAELMRRFYDGLIARGLPPPAALREAQRGVRDQTPYAAPYFWAAFELQGDDRP